MTGTPRVEYRVLYGPSPLAPFAAVVAELSAIPEATYSADRIANIVAERLPIEIARRTTLPAGEISFADLAVAVARTLLDLQGPCELRVDVQPIADNGRRLLLEFVDPQAGVQALRAGLEAAAIVFGGGPVGQESKRALTAMLQRSVDVMHVRQPDYIARALMRVARRRGIPFYAVSPSSRIWLYGQGSRGWHFFEAANERDSFTGGRLTQNKFLSNQLVTRLGLPGVVHAIARDAEAAVQVATALGFPLVVKPIDRGKGVGVRTNLSSVDEVRSAFAVARAQSERGVLVERHVHGDDHRLAVFGGRFAWAVRRSPPRVVGDATHTVAELVARENASRSATDVAAGFVSRLVIDADMRGVLARQRLGPEDRPAAGRVVQLRDIANTATGGMITDCSSTIHPDNRAMAETIARSFRMDALGIDFMTPDITRSWREVPCAVLEVNPTPGFSSDGRAETILDESFPDGTDGRIPSVVLVGAGRSLSERVVKSVEATGRRVGTTDADVTMLGDQLRCAGSRSLHGRVLSLLLDPGCEVIVVATTSEHIEQHGFPLDRCSVALIAEGVAITEPLRNLIGDCAGHTLDGVTETNFDARVTPTLNALLSEAAAGRAS